MKLFAELVPVILHQLAGLTCQFLLVEPSGGIMPVADFPIVPNLATS